MATLKNPIIYVFTLCLIICLLSDGGNAGNQWKKGRKKTRRKSRKFVKHPALASKNEIILPNDTETGIVPKLLDSLKVSNSKALAELKPTKTPSSAIKKKSSAEKKPGKAPKPHIIFVIADDLGFNDVGYHAKGTGCVAHTPTINDLALNGVRLENYYTQSTCSPTRASILTGRYPIRMGMQHGNLESNLPKCLPLEEVTLPDRLKELGYSTHAVGKWHLGFASPRCLPTRRGFDSFLGIVAGSSLQYTYCTNTLMAKCLYQNESIAWGVPYKHSSELYTEHAVDIIRQHDRNVPLFLYLSYQAVHSPLRTPEKYSSFYKERYPGIFERLNGTKRLPYLSLLDTVDVGLRNVTNALRKAGLWDNSVLVFTSDNGGKRKGASNWPLRGRKNSLWEGGIRGTAFVNSPILPSNTVGTVQTSLMHVSDWLPTLVEGVAGGIAEGERPLDGFNMWPTIAKGHPSKRVEVLHNIDRYESESITSNNKKKKYIPPTRRVHDSWAKDSPFNPLINAAIRYENWKLITGYQDPEFSSWMPPEESFKEAIPMSSVHDDPGIYVRLYDISKDPEEKENVALFHRSIVYKLLHRLAYYNDEILVLHSYLNGTDQPGIPQWTDGQELLAWVPWLP